MPLSHIGITVPAAKLDETVAFYLSALAPLGYKEHLRPIPTVVGLGVMYPDFWIAARNESESESEAQTTSNAPVHVAFSTNSRNAVHAFHASALEAGGKCNGAPGPRPEYTRTYYAAFVYDPVGNNIETVCMWPSWTHLGYWVGTGDAFGKGKAGA